jgi:hypothetical protein
MINSVFVVVDDEMKAIRAFQSEPLEVGEKLLSEEFIECFFLSGESERLF